MNEKLQYKLDKRLKNGNLRELRISAGKDFTSNDYLSLARDSRLKQRISSAVAGEISQEYIGFGSGGSRLLSGNYALLQNLEKELSHYFNADSTVVFSTGYMANMGLLSVLADKHDVYLYDENCHASLKDGIRLSQARGFPFKHNNSQDLAHKLQKFSRSAESIFIVTESIFSMDGDSPAAEKFISLARMYNATLIADEAHGTGILGKKGEGLFPGSRSDYPNLITIHTFGKALGAQGACIACDETTAKYIINYSRHFIYTTAISPIQAVSIRESHRYLQENYDQFSNELMKKVQLFKNEAENIIEPNLQNGPIQSVIIGGNPETRQKALKLQEAGFDVRAILSPTVRQGLERIRIILHRHNSDSDVKQLCALLKKYPA